MKQKVFPKKIEIEITADGSATLYLPHLEEHYHSTKGAHTEAMHVYIESAFTHRNCSPCRILEIGFGTGLNAYLTLVQSKKKGSIVHYTALELYPLQWEQIAALNYSTDPIFDSMHQTPWEIQVAITPHFSLRKCLCNLLTHPFDEKYDVIYFDAFAPEKQPELWDESVFSKLYETLAPGGVLTTYCAKGEVRRRLQRAGFIVERLAGPENGKREILRATKIIATF